jgi:hypothetical protein
VHAYSRLTLTDPHPFTDECWDDHHVIPRTEDFPERSAGLERGRCYVETPATAETHAFGMSYGGYNRWRAHLSQAARCPATVWENFATTAATATGRSPSSSTSRTATGARGRGPLARAWSRIGRPSDYTSGPTPTVRLIRAGTSRCTTG